MARKAELPKFYDEDIQKIRMYLQQYPQNFLEARDKAIMALLLRTGIKTSVLTSLDIRDYIRSKSTIIPNHPKAPKQLRLDKQTKNILHNYLNRRRDHMSPLFIAVKKSSYNEPDSQMRLSDRQIQRIIKKFARIKRLRGKFTPKAFRHTLGIYYASLGLENIMIDSVLGNTSPWMKTKYRKRAKIQVRTKPVSKNKLAELNFVCEKHGVKLIKHESKKSRTVWLCPASGCAVTVVDLGTHLEKGEGVLDITGVSYATKR